MCRRAFFLLFLFAGCADEPTASLAGRLATTANTAFSPGVNLVANPGFETGPSPWFSIGMSGRTLVASPAHAGARAVQLQANGSWNRSVSQEIAVTPDSLYAVSVWIASQGLGRGRVALEWRTGLSSAEWNPALWLRADTLAAVIQGTTTWTELTDTVTVPGNAVAVRLQLVAGKGSGTLWADDASFAAVSSPPPPPPPPPPPVGVNLVVNPGFESGTSPWFSIGMSGRTRVATPTHSGAGAVQVQANGSWNRSVSQEVAVTPDSSYAVSAWLSSQGLTRGRVALEWRTGPSSAEWSPAYWLRADTLAPIVQGTTAWTTITDTVTAPHSAVAVRVQVITGKGSGTLWADDFSVEAVSPSSPPPPARRTRDVLLVLLDDMRADQLSYLPLTMAVLAPQSVTFTNAYTPEPDCCPARASLLTGRYSHNTGVWRSYGSNGGAPYFNPQATIATTLRDAGWQTGLWGKYLNVYYQLAPAVQPGWSEWNAMMSDEDQYWTFTLSQNGTTSAFNGTYSPTYLADRAAAWISSRPTTQPLFVYYAPFSPHTGIGPVLAKPALADVGLYANDPLVVAPSFNQVDAGKPAWLRARPPVDSAHQQAIRRSQQETLRSVDREIVKLLNAVQAAGRLDSTLVILASDNGLMHGEHRIEHKFVPYEEAVHVPLVIRYPGIPGRTSSHLVSLVDLAPTIAAWTGTSMSLAPNGADLTPILLSPVAPWRTDLLMEMLAVNVDASPGWRAIRSGSWKYAEWMTGEKELYDLATDPYELTNRVQDPQLAALVAQLAARLATLKVQ